MTIISTLPDDILNGTPIDATPVMANFNQIVNNVNANAAPLNSPAVFTSTVQTPNLINSPIGTGGPATGNFTTVTAVTDNTTTSNIATANIGALTTTGAVTMPTATVTTLNNTDATINLLNAVSANIDYLAVSSYAAAVFFRTFDSTVEITQGATITVAAGAASASLNMGSSAGHSRVINFNTGATLRWQLYVNPSAESGGNAGSDFQLARFTDGGVPIDVPFEIIRSTGQVTLSQPLNIPQATLGTQAPTLSQAVNYMVGANAASWVDVKSSRAFNTVYTNNSGRPLVVYITAHYTTGSGSPTISTQVNSVNILNLAFVSAEASFQLIVPNGAPYELVGTGGSGGTFTIDTWFEF